MYENIFNIDVSQLAGQKLVSNSRVEIGVGAPTLFENGKYGTSTITMEAKVVVTLTGRAVQFSDGTFGYQMIYNDDNYGYIFSDQAGLWNKYGGTGNGESFERAKTELEMLLNYQKKILENNLLCARALEVTNNNTAVLPVAFRKQLFALQMRLALRNDALKESGYLEEITESESPTFSVYNDSLNNFMQNPSIGIVISTTTAIIVAAVIVVVSSVASYILFKKLHREAKTDFKYSNDLTAQLIKYLPEKVYAQLMKENAANAKQANEAIEAASGNTVVKMAKYAGVAFLGFWAVDKFLQSRNFEKLKS